MAENEKVEAVKAEAPEEEGRPQGCRKEGARQGCC